MKSALSSIGYKYAKALIELAAAQGRKLEEEVILDLEFINESIRSVPDFSIILQHPSVSGQEKKLLLVELFQSKINDLSLRLVEMLCDKRRLELLPAIENAYRQLLNEKLNVATATITSAEPLNDSEIELLKSKLAQKLGKELQLKVDVDKSLLGGLVLQVGDEVIDGSIKGKLRAIEKSLLSV